jgi:hypothetical protein
MNADEIVEAVEERLKQLDARADFHIVSKAVRQEDEWWYVPVVTIMHTGQQAPREFAVALLAQVEAEMFEKHKENILFIPSSAA